uniref:Uncharacterized protein n=1 Tax=Anguilla anguilla TaxID=7936 RepID=A0A0E9T360_ANGAN
MCVVCVYLVALLLCRQLCCGGVQSLHITLWIPCYTVCTHSK